MAQTREQAIADLVADVTAQAEVHTVDFLRMGDCYWQHQDDPAAQAACAQAKFEATQALIAEFPALAAELIGPT